MDGSLVDRERSVVRDCEECDEAVWYDTKQVIPPIPEDMSPPPEREVLLCLQCMVLHVAEDEGPEVKWLKPVPERADRHE
jgi:hypothetical protein